MKRGKKNYLQLPIILLSLIGLIYLIFFTSPDQSFSALFFKVSSPPLLFILVFIFVSNLTGFFLKNQRRGIFLGLLVIGILLLIFYRFIHPFFIIMLLALFGVLELVFSKRH